MLELQLPLWWDNALYQVEWDEPRVSEADLKRYMDGRRRGAIWTAEWLALGLYAAFKIRVSVRASRSPGDIYTTLFEVKSVT